MQTLIAETTVEVPRPFLEGFSSRLFGRPPSTTVMVPMIAEALISGPTVGKPGGPSLLIDVEKGRARVILNLGLLPARGVTTVQRVTLREKGTYGRMFPARFHVGRQGAGAPTPAHLPVQIGAVPVADTWERDPLATCEPFMVDDGTPALPVGETIRIGDGALPVALREPGAGGFDTSGASDLLTARVGSLETATTDLVAAGLAEPAGDLEALMREIPPSWSVRWGDGKPFTQAVSADDAFLSRLEVILQEAEREAERLEEAAERTESAKRKAAYSLRAREYRLRMADIVTAQRARAFSRRHAGGVVRADAPYLVGERGPETVLPADAGDRAD